MMTKWAQAAFERLKTLDKNIYFSAAAAVVHVFVVDHINIKISNKKVCLMKADVEETVSWICFSFNKKMLQVLGKKSNRLGCVG